MKRGRIDIRSMTRFAMPRGKKFVSEPIARLLKVKSQKDLTVEMLETEEIKLCKRYLYDQHKRELADALVLRTTEGKISKYEAVPIFVRPAN